MLYYKIDIISELKKKGWTSYTLGQSGKLTCGTYLKIKSGGIVSPDKLDTLCSLLDLQPGDILGFKREGE